MYTSQCFYYEDHSLYIIKSVLEGHCIYWAPKAKKKKREKRKNSRSENLKRREKPPSSDYPETPSSDYPEPSVKPGMKALR